MKSFRELSAASARGRKSAATVVARWLTLAAERLSGPQAVAFPTEALEALAEIAIIRTAINHVGRGVQMIDSTGRIVVANSQAAEMLGVSLEFMAAKPLEAEVMAEQWRRDEFNACSDQLRRQIAGHVTGNQPPRFRRQRPNGQVIEVENVRLAGGGVVRTHTDVTARHEAEQRIAFLAHNDFLTGLANRASFQQAIDEAARDDCGFAVILVDVDHFKQVNDTLGHHFGDALLQEVARRVRAQVREGDVVARIGGDELALLIAPVPVCSVAEAISAQIVDAMRVPFEYANQMRVFSVSLGVAFVPLGTAEPAAAELVQWQADMALYGAKTKGRGCWCAFDPSMAVRETEERRTLVELRAAMDDGQFEVFYQPIIDLRRDTISGFEALIRWRHPLRGLLAACEFIPLIESSGLIVPIGLWVLKRACLDALEWPDAVRILVNLSSQQVSSPGLVESVSQTLADTGLSPHRLEFEVTESSIVQSVRAAEQVLMSLRGLGVRIALDDFGTGYSSLSHIRELRFDTIKIDRSFVSDAAVRADCGAIVRAITSLACDLGIETIAEGVETERQLDWIRGAGCDEAQGYLFSKPVPKAAADILLRDWSRLMLTRGDHQSSEKETLKDEFIQ